MSDQLYEGHVMIKIDGGRNTQAATKQVRASSAAEAKAILENMYGKCLGVWWKGK